MRSQRVSLARAVFRVGAESPNTYLVVVWGSHKDDGAFIGPGNPPCSSRLGWKSAPRVVVHVARLSTRLNRPKEDVDDQPPKEERNIESLEDG